MSFDKAFLALRFQGPLQSWGFDSQYNRRNTGLMPTKSAVAGIFCAALGLPRGSEEEKTALDAFKKVRMTAIAIPRQGRNRELPVRRLQDYHTVQNTRTADGKPKDCHITHRQYLTDAYFGVLLEGDPAFLRGIATALADPKWGIWLGRKTCIPSAPVLAGLIGGCEPPSLLVMEDPKVALRSLIGEESLEAFTRQEEAETFSEGQDTLLDSPISFDTERRLFSPRRVRTVQGARQS